MKKIIGVLLTICMMLQMCTFVLAEEDQVLFEYDLADVPEGSLTENVRGVGDLGSVEVHEDLKTEEKYIEVIDNDPNSAVGLSIPELPLSGVTTISFKMFMHEDTYQTNGPQLYIYIKDGVALTLDLSGSTNSGINYYDGSKYIKTTSVVSKAQLTDVCCIVYGSQGVFSLYVDGALIIDKANLRGDTKITGTGTMSLAGQAKNQKLMHFNIYDFKVKSGEHLPSISEETPSILNPERMLMDYSDAKARLDASLGNAVAMTIGNSVARVNNKYIRIDPANEYVAPFITPDGYTLIPTRFTTETIGCTVEVLSSTSFRFSKDGTTMEINMGDKFAIINGVAKEMPTTPVIKYDRLFIPLRFAAETFGKKVFWDDRGLIVISDNNVVKEGQEEIIKPLINDIRQKTTIAGNEKYSDVSFSVREVRADGHMTGTDTPQLGSIDASKRFMATRNVWSYVLKGDNNKMLRDLGYLNQATLNGQFRDYETMDQSVWAFNGTPIYRSDGLGKTSFGSNWGCANDPKYYENLLMRAKMGIDNGMISWQFDDWATNRGYYNWDGIRGCYCDNCMREFNNYIMNVADPKIVAKTGISDFTNFNYKTYLQDMGIVNNNDTVSNLNKNSALRTLFSTFQSYSVKKLHERLKAEMEEYAGCEIYYSVNSGNSVSTYISGDDGSFINNVVSGKMGETKGSYTTASALYADMIFSRALGLKDVISPLPHTQTDKLNYYAGTAMCYATGLQMVVAWDDYLSTNERYYATLEEMDHLFELPREYPWLFDNYEVPELIGYVYDLDTMASVIDPGAEFLEKSIPARAIANQDDQATFKITKDKVSGLQAVVVEPSVFDGLPSADKQALETSGVPVVKTDDTATVNWLENTFWMVKDNNSEVYSVLRQNELYDNAPVVVHAVSYAQTTQENVELEINNLYLPEGDTFTVNVYVPGKNSESMKVKKGEGTTKIKLNTLSRWAVLEICGPSSVRREAKFDLGIGVNGIGLGSRISNDKVYGTIDNFTIVTYSEGLNSTVFGDKTGSQDEAAFVYKRLGTGKLKNANVSAGFESAGGAYGVMIREGIYSNARYVALMYDSTNGLRLARRLATNKGTLYENLGNEKPEYMKLERDGSNWMAFVSNDGTNYKKIATVKMEFDETIGGVFATSPDGKRSECKVKNFAANTGNYGNENFTRFKISYPGGSVDEYTVGEKLKIDLETDNFNNLTVNDVNIKFTSSDESVVRIAADGTIVPKKPGSVTITATASMNMKRITASCPLEITEVSPIMWEEDFSEGVLPSYMKPDNEALTVIDGVYTALTKENMKESNTTFTIPLRKLPTVYEFDFRAHFGTESPTTGVRVIYANGTAVSLTAGKGGFNWFFGGAQNYIAPIEEDKWYHIKIEIDYNTQRANVYIDNNQVVTDSGGRSGFAPNGAMQVGGWRLGTDSKYEWDNFKVYFVAPEN